MSKFATVKVASPNGLVESHTAANARDLVNNAGWVYANPADAPKNIVAPTNSKSSAAEAQAVIDKATGNDFKGRDSDDNDND